MGSPGHRCVPGVAPSGLRELSNVATGSPLLQVEKLRQEFEVTCPVAGSVPAARSCSSEREALVLQETEQQKTVFFGEHGGRLGGRALPGMSEQGPGSFHPQHHRNKQLRILFYFC